MSDDPRSGGPVLSDLERRRFGEISARLALEDRSVAGWRARPRRRPRPLLVVAYLMLLGLGGPAVFLALVLAGPTIALVSLAVVLAITGASWLAWRHGTGQCGMASQT